MSDKDELAHVLLKSFIFFHGTYWIVRILLSGFSYNYNNLPRDNRGYFCACCVSSQHAIIISFLALRAIIEEPLLMKSNNFFYQDANSDYVVGIFLGYVASDLLLTLYYRSRWKGWLENLVHHILILLCYSELYFNRVGAIVITPSLLCELTTPFINFRWILSELGYRSSRAYFINGLVMTASWFFIRILWYSYLGLKVFWLKHQVLSRGILRGSIFYISYLSGLLLQYLWFYKIIRGSIKFLYPEPSKPKKS